MKFTSMIQKGDKVYIYDTYTSSILTDTAVNQNDINAIVSVSTNDGRVFCGHCSSIEHYLKDKESRYLLFPDKESLKVYFEIIIANANLEINKANSNIEMLNAL